MIGAIAERNARTDALAKLLDDHARIAIVGGPRTGKSRLASLVADRPVICTDRFSYLGWGDVPAAVIAQCTALPSFVLEGIQVARALRSGLVVDAVLYLDEPKAEQSKGQITMGKGVSTVFAEWRAGHLGVHVVSPDLFSGGAL